MSEAKVITLSEFKADQYKTDQALDSIGKVELVEVFFDSIVWTTPKAIRLKKGNKTAWVARKIIQSVELSETEPCSLWILSWAILDWKD